VAYVKDAQVDIRTVNLVCSKWLWSSSRM